MRSLLFLVVGPFLLGPVAFAHEAEANRVLADVEAYDLGRTLDFEFFDFALPVYRDDQDVEGADTDATDSGIVTVEQDVAVAWGAVALRLVD